MASFKIAPNRSLVHKGTFFKRGEETEYIAALDADPKVEHRGAKKRLESFKRTGSVTIDGSIDALLDEGFTRRQYTIQD